MRGLRLPSLRWAVCSLQPATCLSESSSSAQQFLHRTLGIVQLQCVDMQWVTPSGTWGRQSSRTHWFLLTHGKRIV